MLQFLSLIVSTFHLYEQFLVFHNPLFDFLLSYESVFHSIIVTCNTLHDKCDCKLNNLKILILTQLSFAVHRLLPYRIVSIIISVLDSKSSPRVLQ